MLKTIEVIRGIIEIRGPLLKYTVAILAYPGLRLGATVVIRDCTGIMKCVRVHKRYIEYT